MKNYRQATRAQRSAPREERREATTADAEPGDASNGRRRPEMNRHGRRRERRPARISAFANSSSLVHPFDWNWCLYVVWENALYINMESDGLEYLLFDDQREVIFWLLWIWFSSVLRLVFLNTDEGKVLILSRPKVNWGNPWPCYTGEIPFHWLPTYRLDWIT